MEEAKKYPRGLAGQVHPIKQRHIRRRLNELHEELGSWSQVKELFGEDAPHESTLAAVGRGQRPGGKKVWDAVRDFDGDKFDPEKEREVEVTSEPLRVRVSTNGNAPETVPELLQVVRKLVDTAIAEVDRYMEEETPSPFAVGGLRALRGLLEGVREGSTL